MRTKRYQIKEGDKWITCVKAIPVKREWLHYQLKDGTNGLKRPGEWRVKDFLRDAS